MTVSNNNTVFTYTSYKWTNDNDEKFWSPIIRSINGVKIDISGDDGYIEFELQYGFNVYSSTKIGLDDWLYDLGKNEELFIECN